MLVAILKDVYQVAQPLEELAAMSVEELDAFLETMRVYARMPKH